MFLGADKYKHEDYRHIKKCSQCGDKKLRYLGLWGNTPGLPLWLCGNGHLVYPFYDELNEWFTYVIYEGNIPSFLIDANVTTIPGGVSDYNCCEIPKSGVSKNVLYPLPDEQQSQGDEYPCKIPRQLSIGINGILGVLGSRSAIKHVKKACCQQQLSSFSPTDCISYGDEDLGQVGVTCCNNRNIGYSCACNEWIYNWVDGAWKACECSEEEYLAWDEQYPGCESDPITGEILNWEICKYAGLCNWFKCVKKCTETPEFNSPNIDFYNAPAEFWAPLNYGIDNLGPRCDLPPKDKRECQTWPICYSNDYINCTGSENAEIGGASGCTKCNEAIPLVACHECGTLRCSNQDLKYRVECDMPNEYFTYPMPGMEGLSNANQLMALFGLPHNITAISCSDIEITIPYEAARDLDTIFPTDCAKREAQSNIPFIFNAKGLYTGFNTEVRQPTCLRRQSRNPGGAVNTGDISNQTIILDRVKPFTNASDAIWEEEDKKGRPGVTVQPFINQTFQDLGSDIEPEIIAIIHSESGVGGQVAFQTWPVAYDVDDDQLISLEHPNPDNPDQCRKYYRPKARGYGIMYPFIDDPIWKTDYNFPIFLAGKNYKVGDKIEFRFWQTLDGDFDPANDEIFREVVIASGVVTEVNSEGGILWYEFSGTPIAGDCPCARDEYCGYLSSACYPEDHPNTEDGLNSSEFIDGGFCYQGEPVCEQLTEGSECDLGDIIYVPGNCWPHQRSWELSSPGYYGKSSCSGLAVAGQQARLENNATIPAKAAKYYYSWLPEPECFLGIEPNFLEYLAYDNTYFSYGYNFNGELFSACSPLVKIYRNEITQGYEIKTRFNDYNFVPNPCRKSDNFGDANTLFVSYADGDGNIEPENSGQNTRTLDNYCRVYGFYQQKQYDCSLRYQGEYIMRSHDGLGYSAGCEPKIGLIDISFERKEAKTDITIAAPVNQDYIMPEYLPEPDSDGLVESYFPYYHGSVEKWQLKNPNINFPDPRNNCEINLRKYYEANVLEYDCDEFCNPAFDEFGFFTGWDCYYNEYKEYNYIDVLGNNRQGWRTNFRDSCGYPWEMDCKKVMNEDFKEVPPECYVDENGELICNDVNISQNETETVDKCDPFCMFQNTSAIIAIKEIEQDTGCPNSNNLITDGNSSFDTKCYGSVAYSHRIVLTGTNIGLDIYGNADPYGLECATYGNLNENKENVFTIFAYGSQDADINQLKAKADEYLSIWEARYASIGRPGLPGWRALYDAEPDNYPVDNNLSMFFSKMFEVEGVAKIRVLFNICDMAMYTDCDAIGGIANEQDFINYQFGEGLTSNGLGGSVKSVSILNPGNGYAFEVEERYAPTGIINPQDMMITIESSRKNKKRKSETWSLSDYTLTHSGIGYEIGQTIPLLFNDTDAIRDGVGYLSYPTLEVTNVNISGQITETQIINSGEYYKWIKTGEHRAYPISININNYWEGPDGAVGLGKHLELKPIVDVKPSSYITKEIDGIPTQVLIPNPAYGSIVDVKITNSGMDYFLNGKYWVINSNFQHMQLDHLVDPCKYDVNVADPNDPVISGIGFIDLIGNRYVNPPMTMNGGNVIKWSDKVKSWNTVIYSGNCPVDLMKRTYYMALTEGVDLMPAYCNGSECQAIKQSWDQYLECLSAPGTPECEEFVADHLLCNRFTGFYGDAFNIVNIEGGNGDTDAPFGTTGDDWAETMRLLNRLGLGGKAGRFNAIDGCDIRTEGGQNGIPCGGSDSVIDGGRGNAADSCNGNNEYTLLKGLHRIYRMGGQDITMTISPIYD
jgi:hypothetical protein